LASPGWVGLVDLEAHLAAHHQLGELLLVGILGGDVGRHLTPAHDGDLIRDGQDLPQLVGDEDDGRPLIPQLFQHLEQMIRLLRGQNPGRLVQDQDAGAAIERLEDLDPLLQAHRQILDLLVQRHFETIVPCQLAQQLFGRRQALAQVPAVFRAENDVFQNVKLFTSMKCWCTMPMPAAIASWEPWGLNGLPSMNISPLSAW
jgi:hypothetical protein